MPSPHRRGRSGAVRAALVVAVALAGCDDGGFDLTAAPGEPVALFGVLDAAADTQLVRVAPVRQTPLAEPFTLDGFRATLTDDAGTVRDGAAVVLALADGTSAAAFRFVGPVASGGRQRFTLALPGGTAASADADVPPARAARVDAAVRDSLGRIRQGVLWNGFRGGAPRSVVRYRLLPRGTADTVVVAVGPRAQGREAGGWRSVVGLTEDRPFVFEVLRRPQADSTVRLLSVEVEVAEQSPEWATAGQERPPNLTGAYGFFGALGVSRVRFVPDAATLRALRYRP